MLTIFQNSSLNLIRTIYFWYIEFTQYFYFGTYFIFLLENIFSQSKILLDRLLNLPNLQYINKTVNTYTNKNNIS